MRRRLLSPAALGLIFVGAFVMGDQPMLVSESDASVHVGHRMSPGGSVLPTVATAEDVLNTTGRHGEWLRIRAGSGTLLTFVVYPDRADKAPVLIVSGKRISKSPTGCAPLRIRPPLKDSSRWSPTRFRA